MEIYISRSGERYGPYSLSEVQADINAGNIQPTDLAWHEGIPDWSEVWQLEGITVPKRRVPPPPPPPPPPSLTRGAYYPSTPHKPASGGEMILLILLSLLLPIIGLIIGIIRISTPEKKSEGTLLLTISIVMIFVYLLLYRL